MWLPHLVSVVHSQEKEPGIWPQYVGQEEESDAFFSWRRGGWARLFDRKLVAHKNKSCAQTRHSAGYAPMYLDSGSEKVRFWSLQAALRSLRDPWLPCCLGFLAKNSSHTKIKVMRRRAAVQATRPCTWIPDLRF
jgi:hypothetical protein